MNKKLEHTIRDNFSKALNDFNFSKVHSVMTHLGWCWGRTMPPNQGEMIEMVERNLFEDAIKFFKGEYISVSSGGFHVTIFKTGRVKIQFVVEESWSID